MYCDQTIVLFTDLGYNIWLLIIDPFNFLSFLNKKKIKKKSKAIYNSVTFSGTMLDLIVFC